jgi:hypothetical protein
LKIFFLYVFGGSLLFASSGLEDARRIAQQRYHQSDHYKSIVQNEVIAEETVGRQDFITEERSIFEQLMKKELHDRVFIDFVQTQTNKQKLTLLNIMKELWQRSTSVLFEDWIIENIELQNPVVSILKSQVDHYKNLDGQFDFYHYICLTMVFSKAHPLLDNWDIDLTVLEIVLSQFEKLPNEGSFDEVMNSFKYYLNDDVNLMKQVVYWQRYKDHLALALPIIDFFKHLEENPFQYRQFLCEVIDEELARSFEELP